MHRPLSLICWKDTRLALLEWLYLIYTNIHVYSFSSLCLGWLLLLFHATLPLRKSSCDFHCWNSLPFHLTSHIPRIPSFKRSISNLKFSTLPHGHIVLTFQHSNLITFLLCTVAGWRSCTTCVVWSSLLSENLSFAGTSSITLFFVICEWCLTMVVLEMITFGVVSRSFLQQQYLALDAWS